VCNELNRVEVQIGSIMSAVYRIEALPAEDYCFGVKSTSNTLVSAICHRALKRRVPHVGALPR
jgi:hypothetical protein